MSLKILFVVSTAITLLACQNNRTSSTKEATKKMAKGDNENTPNTSVSFSYDLSQPQQQWTLPAGLEEVSGNTWIDNDHLLLIEDMHPKLYLIKLGNTATIEKTIPFGPDKDNKFDIEDVTIVGHTAYALWSHGKFFKIKNWNQQPEVSETKTFLHKNNNTEGLCYDPVTGQLLIACKNESDVSDVKKSTRAIYAYNLKNDEMLEEPFLLIHKKELEKVASDKMDFYPSAIAVHPVTHDIYILSTKDTKCLAQFSHEGTVKSVQFLDKDRFPQPEGICFSPDGILYISTEGKHGDPGQLLKFLPKSNK